MLGSISSWCQIGSRSLAIGAYTLGGNDMYQLFNNPAGVQSENIVLISHLENRFLINKLSQNYLGFGAPIKNSHWGMTLFHTGFQSFSESCGTFWYAQSLSKNFRASVGLNVHFFSETETYGNVLGISSDIGLHYALNEKINLGLRITNITSANHPTGNDALPQSIILGTEIKISQTTFIYADIHQSVEQPFAAGLGFEWAPHPQFFLRAGSRSTPQINSFGLGYRSRNLQIDLSYAYIPILGATPSISLVYSLNQKTD